MELELYMENMLIFRRFRTKYWGKYKTQERNKREDE